MKYFTLITLSILAVNASNSGTPVVEEPNPFQAAFSGVLYSIQNLFATKKNLIKARLELPKPLSADTFVTVSPTENICVFANKSEFWRSLYKQTDLVKIEKIIFCPEATSYLKDLDAAKLTGAASNDQLRSIIAALLLRRETLINKYSQSYVDSQYLACYDTLWSRVYSTKDYWPCNGSPCTASDVKSNFATFIQNTPACKVIMSDQLTAYADKVAEITTQKDNPVTSAVEVRDAILENLSGAPHFSVNLASVRDTIGESNNLAAAEKIQSVLADVKAVLDKQSDGKSTVFTDAKQCFESRLNCANDTVSNSETLKTETGATLKTETSNNGAKTETGTTDTPKTETASDKAKTETTTGETLKATPTEKEPTKTEK